MITILADAAGNSTSWPEAFVAVASFAMVAFVFWCMSR